MILNKKAALVECGYFVYSGLKSTSMAASVLLSNLTCQPISFDHKMAFIVIQLFLVMRRDSGSCPQRKLSVTPTHVFAGKVRRISLVSRFTAHDCTGADRSVTWVLRHPAIEMTLPMGSRQIPARRISFSFMARGLQGTCCNTASNLISFLLV